MTEGVDALYSNVAFVCICPKIIVNIVSANQSSVSEIVQKIR